MAFAAALVAFAVRGWLGPAAVLLVMLACAAAARVTRRVVVVAIVTLPLVLSILIVNTLAYPGAHDPIAVIGPLRPTWTGLVAALQAVLRVLAFGASVTVFVLTTPTADLLAELERRGLGRRGAFVVGAAVGMVPRIAARAGEIGEAQRSRALDTEGAIWRRARGVVPLAGPLIQSSLAEVEERTMALEARAFSAPDRRTTIRMFPDSPVQRVLRWILVGGAIALLVASIAGFLEFMP